jgi:hypothetical protein
MRVLDLSRAYILSRAIHVAAELGLADHVGETPVPVRELARLTGTQPAFLERLLRLLAGNEIFAEAAPGEFVATPSSNVLRDDAPGSLRAGMCMVNTAWWAAVGDLGHSIKTGETAFKLRHEEGFFGYLKQAPEHQLRFDAGMASNSRSGDEAIARAYDFSRAATVMDIGGGRGGLIGAIVALHAGVKGILFDQPQVVERSVLPTTGPLASRCSVRAGDFFEGVPTGADLYLIKGVLHDFDDEKCVTILRSCRRAMSPQSKLLIVERSISPDNQPHQAKTIDVLMMALLGGKERSTTDWVGLLRAADLELVRQISTASEFTISEVATAPAPLASATTRA